MTDSVATQYWFNHGLNWCFGFNQEEGVACFLKALETDPNCAMAHWGVAYAAGPFYNLPWRDFGEMELIECTGYCYDHVQKALKLSEKCSAEERGLITALAKRFQQPEPVAEALFSQWDDDYADAMRRVYREYPQDQDIAALFVEAMMTRTPWKMWDVSTNEPYKNADTLECIEVLEKAINDTSAQGAKPHPAILHLHIHVLEMSADPELALESSDTLTTLCPQAGHMNHMPGHIYVLCGRYDKAKTASEKAIQADRLYRAYAGDNNFYSTACCHDLHLMMYTCMFLGQFEAAMAATEEMCELLTPDLIATPDKPQMTTTLEGYFSMKMHVLVRFGKWQEIIEEPMMPRAELYLASVPMWHYAKGIAYATLGKFDEADEQTALFFHTRGKVPADRKIFNNTVIDILGVAEQMLLGEVAYHKGDHEIGFDHLRKSVELDDNLAYSEPWAWMHPPRHALGALLLEQAQIEEAEAVYRADLGLSDGLYRCAQHPGNVWSLHGLAEILKRKGDVKELSVIQRQLDQALVHADQDIRSSCCCRKSS